MAQAAAPVLLTLKPSGQTALPTPVTGLEAGVQGLELLDLVDVDGTSLQGSKGGKFSGGGVINRSIATKSGKPRTVAASAKSKSHPEMTGGFDGLSLRDQRLANGGNQFTVEPPDQALCVGNGYVLESVNDVLRVFDGGGTPLTGVIDLNSFYKYPAAIDRATGRRGPAITDPVCLFDKDTQRWFHVVLTLDQTPGGALTGGNHLDIAVSTTASPLDPWTIYSLPAVNNGTMGTPDHKCDGGFCLGDYPHIGANADAIFLTTNEFALFGSGFYGAQIYTISKKALVTAAANVPVVLMNTGDADVPYPGFTVWPAQALSASAAGGMGTEFLMSSLAVFTDDGTSNQILLWTIANTGSINAPTPALQLKIKPIAVSTYSVPPLATQKPGNTPLRDCIANSANDGCYRRLYGALPPFANPVSPIDASDSRMQQVFYANGKLWAALGTGVSIPGDSGPRAGIAYYVVNPTAGKLELEGTVALAGNNVIYPSIAVTNSGRGVLGFSLTGNDHFPSAAYTSLDAIGGAGAVTLAQEGAGPQDGFSGYLPFSNRPRWGDYGAAATDGTSVWIANEYIAQSCTLAQYEATPFGSCGGTRVALGNWGTRITRLQP